jgi:hypothetical protein
MSSDGTSTRPTCAPSSTASATWSRAPSRPPPTSRRYPGAHRAPAHAVDHRRATSICIVSGQPHPDAARCWPPSSRSTASPTTSSSSRTTCKQHPARPVPRAARPDPLQAAGACSRSRGKSPPAPSETLFGDDAEADAIVYCLYADLLAGRVEPRRPRARCCRPRAPTTTTPARILELARRVPPGDVVKRMFIHLDRRSPPQGFRRNSGPRLVPVFNYFQDRAGALRRRRADRAPGDVRRARDARLRAVRARSTPRQLACRT